MTCTGGSPGANWFRKGFPKGKLEVGLENSLYHQEFAEGLASAIGNLLCRLGLGSLQYIGIQPPLATCNVSENLSVETLSAHDECISAVTFHVCDFQYSSSRPSEC